ncbi:CCN family member 2-like [Penaeus chinensis]|uniref:CCN family member 2-like n=1 Tax=Penaeus chinensis TaxID=139456 RepID=UPI001FB7D6FB|nr:CCN family member 2-like [Penaeus chinensis]
MPGTVGQRAPCYECEMYKESHPHSHPYTVIRSHCVYPCECGSVPDCPPGVPVIMDGCGCCWQCARQEGESCNGATLCDASRSLTCLYNSTADPTGTCQEVRPARCFVNNRTFDDGESFTLDCRTQCTCKNGTYACASLCPGESLPPSAQCHHPRLVKVPGQCCREWMCDRVPGKLVVAPDCGRVSGRWSACSQTCGAGVSVRWSTDKVSCQPVNETRLCQLRPCQDNQRLWDGEESRKRQQSRKHHIRRGHVCKATQRRPRALRLQSGACVSVRRYRPKVCGACKNRCCTVFTATTIAVPFYCPVPKNETSSGARSHRTTSTTTTTTTTATPSVYDMMDEGQPVLDVVVSYDPQGPAQYRDGHYWGASYSGERYRSGKDDRRADNYRRLSYRVGDYTDDNYHAKNLDERDDDRSATGSRDPRDSEEDQPLPVAQHDLTLEDQAEEDLAWARVLRTPHEKVSKQVEWIMRCKCSRSCEAPPTAPVAEEDHRTAARRIPRAHSADPPT